MDRKRVHINPAPPFDFELIIWYHAYSQRHLSENLLEGGVYKGLVELNSSLRLVSVSSTGSVDRPGLDIEVLGEVVGDKDTEEAAKKIAWTLGTTTDLQEFYAAAQQDPVLKTITKDLYGLHPTHSASVFEALVYAITAQQIASNVARLIRSLLMERYAPKLSVDGQVYYTFPGPEAILAAGMEGLRNAKLSTRKAEYILDIASKVAEGSLALESMDHLSDEEVGEQLVQLRGVGKWTSQWLQIRAMGRPNACPAGDLALQRIISRAYLDGQPVTESEVEEFSKRWSPHRSLSTSYLFAALRKGIL